MLSALLAHGHDIRSLPREDAGLTCLAASAGYEQRKNEIYSWDGMKRGSTPFLVIQHTTFGEGRLDYAGTDYRLTPGQCMLVTMPHPHRYYLQKGGHWEYFWAVLHGREALRLARQILDAAGPVLTPDEAQTNRLAQAILTLIATPNLSPGEASTAAYTALSALHDTAFSKPRSEAPLPAALSRVLSHIEANLAAPLPIDRLAQVANLSRAHFVRHFTQALGLPPSTHVLNRRLERIERLLLASELTVAEIAKATGFRDANYLAKAFRKHRGLSPLAYRATRAEAR